MRSDPSDTGGLFVGRRPGTQPVHYRSKPVLGNPRQRRRDALLGHCVLALMALINLTFWGPVEAGWLWIVSHTPILVEHIFFATVVAFIGILLTLIAALAVCKQLDEIWILMRRASGVDQRDGVIGRVFAYTAMVGVTLFGLWLVFGGGLASSGTAPGAP
jgi:ABC-type amino acid transport system permease subunit